MTSKERLLTAINHGIPDRLPVTTHHLMKSLLDTYMDGISDDEFFDYFDMDAVRWILPFRSEPGKVAVNDDGHTHSNEMAIVFVCEAHRCIN